MARFNGPSAAASAHAAMMRAIKVGKGDSGGGCVILPFALIAVGVPLFARLIV